MLIILCLPTSLPLVIIRVLTNLTAVEWVDHGKNRKDGGCEPAQNSKFMQCLIWWCIGMLKILCYPSYLPLMIIKVLTNLTAVKWWIMLEIGRMMDLSAWIEMYHSETRSVILCG